MFLFPINDKKGKWGFINELGGIEIPPQYDYANDFHEGLSCICVNGKSGYIDANNSIIIPTVYDEGHGFSEGIAFVSNGDKYGAINRGGKEIIPFIYDDADSYGFIDNRATVSINGKYGAIDKSNNAIMPIDYDWWVRFSGDICVLQKKRDEFTSYYLFNSRTNQKKQIKFEDVGEEYSEGKTMVSNQNEGYGYIDLAGDLAIPCQYIAAHCFSEGVAIVRCDDYDDFIEFSDHLEDDRVYGAINHDNQLIFSTECFEMGDFTKEGLVRFRKYHKEGFMNKAGEIAIPPIYDFVESFRNGLAKVEVES